jgi:hypothetical protein
MKAQMETTEMDGIAGKRTAMDDDFLRRRRIQKLRWLGLNHEADRLAAEAAPEIYAVRAPLPVEYPETD